MNFDCCYMRVNSSSNVIFNHHIGIFTGVMILDREDHNLTSLFNNYSKIVPQY
jgi:hypothetical protein